MAAVIIAASMLASRVLGVLREMLLARAAGVQTEKNALDLAFLIPDLLNHVVSTGFLGIIFIPIFTGYIVRGDDQKAWRFFSNTLNVLAIALLLLVVPAWIWMKPLLLAFTAADPSPEVLEKAVHFGRIVLPAQIFFLAGSFLVAVQHTRKHFLFPALTGITYNIAIVAGGILWPHGGLDGFAWGVPVGAFFGFFILQMIGLRVSSAQKKLQWLPYVNFRDPDLGRYLSMMLPLAMGIGAMFGLELVLRSYGAMFGDTAISALGYAYRVMYTLVAVFGFSVGVASYPDMSRLAKQGEMLALQTKVFKSLGRMLAILVAAVAAVWLLAHPIVRLLFERGAFDRNATDLVAGLLRWYLPASIGLCMQAVLVRAFYARESMWTPTLVNSGLFALSLPFYSLLQAHGPASVPLVGTIVSLAQVFVLVWLWKRNVPATVGDLYNPVGDIVRALVALAILFSVLWWLDPYVAPWLASLGVWSLGLLAGGGMALLFALALGLQIALGSGTALELTRELRQKLSRKLGFPF